MLFLTIGLSVSLEACASNYKKMEQNVKQHCGLT